MSELEYERPDSISGRAHEGGAVRARAQGARSEDLIGVVRSLDPELAEWTDSFVFGTVWTRAGLTFEERVLAAIAALAAGGHVTQLRAYLHGALQAGVPEEKIHEVLTMMVVYAGFPRAINALDLWKTVRDFYARQDTGSRSGER